MLGLLAAGILTFLALPLLVPQTTSGTLNNREAAGPEAEFVTVNGLEVHVVRADYTGDCACNEPLIILMHGFGASTYSWRDVIEPLSEAGTVLAYDRPAFGFTERPTTWEGTNPFGDEGNFELLDVLIAQFGAGHPVVLVGHSAGGALAAEYTLRNPDTVQGLILADPAILTTGAGPDWVRPLLDLPQIDAIGPSLVGSIASSGDDLLRQSFVDQSLLTPAVYDGYHQPLKIAGWERAFWEFVRAPRSTGLAQAVSSISTPTLLITGDADTVVPTSDTEKLATMIPNATLVVVPGAGHLPQEEQATIFATAVIDWIRANEA
jgi:pimeloyl-ACP methyl ester carboxylesterase